MTINHTNPKVSFSLPWYLSPPTDHLPLKLSSGSLSSHLTTHLPPCVPETTLHSYHPVQFLYLSSIRSPILIPGPAPSHDSTFPVTSPPTGSYSLKSPCLYTPITSTTTHTHTQTQTHTHMHTHTHRYSTEFPEDVVVN